MYYSFKLEYGNKSSFNRLLRNLISFGCIINESPFKSHLSQITSLCFITANKQKKERKIGLLNDATCGIISTCSVIWSIKQYELLVNYITVVHLIVYSCLLGTLYQFRMCNQGVVSWNDPSYVPSKDFMRALFVNFEINNTLTK